MAQLTSQSIATTPKQKYFVENMDDRNKNLLVNVTTSKVRVSFHLLSGRFGSSNIVKTYRNYGWLDRLILFLQEKCPDGGYLFWAGLTAGHYALGPISFLEDACMPMIRREG